MVSVSILALAVIATLVATSSAQLSYADSLLRGIGRRGPAARGGVRPRLVDPVVGAGRRGAVRGWEGQPGGAWGDQRRGGAEVFADQVSVQLSECRALRQCDVTYDCELNRRQDGVDCVDYQTGDAYPLSPSGFGQRNGAFGRFDNRNSGLSSNIRQNVIVAGQKSSAWRAAACCMRPQPLECLPRGVGAVSRAYWSFQNGQCVETPLLQRFVSRIGVDPDYGNFYPSQRECYDKCDRPSLPALYAQCFQTRPAACIPPTDCQASLYSDNYFRYNLDTHRCERTQILNTHIRFIGQQPDYRNFFTDLDSCNNVCPMDAYKFNY